MSEPDGRTISREQSDAIHAETARCISAVILRRRGQVLDEQLLQTMLAEVETARLQVMATLDRLAE